MNPHLLRRAPLLASLALLWPILAGSGDTPPPGQTALRPGTQEPRSFRASVTTEAAYEYQIFVPQAPAGPATTPARPWPLLIFLHGAGERGSDVAKVTVHGPPRIVGSRPDFPFVVASPQCPDHAFWDPAQLDLFLDHLLATYPVDPSRVCLTGLSMGGNGSWAWATRSPHRFAAVAPICGWADPVRVWLASGPRREALSRLPIWAFHGAKDNVVPLEGSQAMVAAFERIGNKPRLTIDPEAGHDSWTAAYANTALYDWFLTQRRP